MDISNDKPCVSSDQNDIKIVAVDAAKCYSTTATNIIFTCDIKTTIVCGDVKITKPLTVLDPLRLPRYLGSGNSINDLHFKFKRGRSTISRTISSVCQAVWKYLRPQYIEEITVEKLQNIALDFDLKANFAHCFGAIDGKHIRLIKPAKSGSLFYNYKIIFQLFCWRLLTQIISLFLSTWEHMERKVILLFLEIRRFTRF